MKHSKFQEEYHWMNGLSEYYKFKGKETDDLYTEIHKALYHNNWYRKRDIMIELCSRLNSNPLHVKAWMNVLLHEQLDDVEVKPQLVATLLRKYMREDKFLVNVCQFVNYWVTDGNAADMPDMNDFLSRGQVKSKLWMAEELGKIVDGSLGTVAFYGGWYNFLAHILYDKFEIDNVLSLDLDERVIDPSKRLYPEEVSAETFLPITTDVNKIKWQGKNMHTFSAELEKKHTDAGNTMPQDIKDKSYVDRGKVNVVINTSCEHMDNTWFDNLPTGTFVVLQTNDYFSNPQHSNCCTDLESVKKKYPLNDIMYEGELDTHLYNRFMLIGSK